MNCSTAFSMKMESKKMATKALEIMKSVLAQADADGFNYDSVSHTRLNYIKFNHFVFSLKISLTFPSL